MTFDEWVDQRNKDDDWGGDLEDDLKACWKAAQLSACSSVCRYCNQGIEVRDNKKKNAIHLFVHILPNEVVICEASAIRYEMTKSL